MRELFAFVAGFVTAIGLCHVVGSYVEASERQLASIAARYLRAFMLRSHIVRIYDVDARGKAYTISLIGIAKSLDAYAEGKTSAEDIAD